MKSAFVLRCICLLSLALLNTACVTQQPRISGNSAAHNANELKTWSATGKIGVSGIEQSGSGSFNWQQENDISKLLVRGPVGVGSLQITLNDKQLSMQSSDGTQYNAEQVLDQLETRLGVPLPVSQLRYWLLGVPGPGKFQWNETNDALDQNGWHIAYGEWQQHGDLRVPVRLILTREQLRIVMVVQSWQLNS